MCRRGGGGKPVGRRWRWEKLGVREESEREGGRRSVVSANRDQEGIEGGGRIRSVEFYVSRSPRGLVEMCGKMKSSRAASTLLNELNILSLPPLIRPALARDPIRTAPIQAWDYHSTLSLSPAVSVVISV